MKRFIILLFVSTLSLFSPNARSAEGFSYGEKPKKYNLSICSIFKNEASSLKEWIEYHRLVGVDHFYLYNLGSTDRYREALSRYIKKGIVTLVNWTDYVGEKDGDDAYLWALGTQIPAYENAAKFLAIHETKWLVFVDIGEFLVSPSAKLTDVLEKYENYPGITLASDFFNASPVDVLPRRKLVIESLELIKPPVRNLQKAITKTIFKPEFCRGFIWPPYTCLFKEGQTAITVRKPELRINHYMNRYEGYAFGKVKNKLPVANWVLSDEEAAEFLNLGYEIEDQERVIYRFVPEVLKKLGHEPGWGW